MGISQGLDGNAGNKVKLDGVLEIYLYKSEHALCTLSPL